MKKFLVRSLGFLFIASPSLAMATSHDKKIGPGKCPDAINTAGGANTCGGLIPLITNISNTILLVVGVVAVLFLIVGGFQYITSAGNPETVGKAKTTILYAIIGILVVLLAYAIVNFVLVEF